jgi:hypothetical protein
MMSGMTKMLQRAMHSSFVRDVLNSLDKDRIVSTIQTTSTQLTHAVEKSFLYRWLTTDSEPNVIIIDLQETWTLGPVLGLLNHLMDKCRPYWRESFLETALAGVSTIIKNTGETRIGQFLSRVLLPPESASPADEQEES